MNKIHLSFVIGLMLITISLTSCVFLISTPILEVQKYRSDKIRLEGCYYSIDNRGNATFLIFYKEGLYYGDPYHALWIKDPNLSQNEIEDLIRHEMKSYPISKHLIGVFKINGDSVIVQRNCNHYNKSVCEYYLKIHNSDSLIMTTSTQYDYLPRAVDIRSLKQHYKFMTLDTIPNITRPKRFRIKQ